MSLAALCSGLKLLLRVVVVVLVMIEQGADDSVGPGISIVQVLHNRARRTRPANATEPITKTSIEGY